jgi:hypothetical protein
MTTDRRRRSRRRIGSSTPPSPPARRPRPRGKRGEILALTQRWPAVWLDRLNGQLLDPKSDLDWIERLIRDQLAGMVLEAQTWGTWTHPSVLETLDGAKRSLKRLIFHYRAEKCEDADRIIDVALDGIGWLEKLPQLDPAPLVRLRRCPGPDCPRRWHWTRPTAATSASAPTPAACSATRLVHLRIVSPTRNSDSMAIPLR